jgi:Ala-tRNA(Pro) deacylase
VTGTERKVLDVLGSLGIAYVRHDHPPVFTVEDADRYWTELRGTHCKNLFLRNKKGNHHYLVVAPTSRNIDLRRLNKILGEDRLSFGSPERLSRFLGLEPGSVSPFGLINDAAKEVRVIVDEDLRNSRFLGFHPNINTVTLDISYEDFEKFLAWSGHEVRYLDLQGRGGSHEES